MYLPQRILGYLAEFIFRIYSSTFRYYPDFKNFTKEEIDSMLSSSFYGSENYIYAFWHQDELAFLTYFSNKNILAMVSHSKDGTIMDQALSNFGYKTVRGSSSKGGLRAFLKAMKMIQSGYHFTMAVDGPRGPIYQAKEGVTRLSEKTKTKIICCRAYPQNYFLFKKSWNQAKLPMPFSKIILRFERPAQYSLDDLNKKLKSL